MEGEIKRTKALLAEKETIIEQLQDENNTYKPEEKAQIQHKRVVNVFNTLTSSLILFNERSIYDLFKTETLWLPTSEIFGNHCRIGRYKNCNMIESISLAICKLRYFLSISQRYQKLSLAHGRSILVLIYGLNDSNPQFLSINE